MQLKIHKEGNPDRPVISSVNYSTTEIFQYVGHDLQPNIEELESFAKDSIDFMKKVFTTDKIPQERFLDTMDVRSLYTNIPNNEGIKAVETKLKWKSFQTKVIISFLKPILTLNNFIFNFANFSQIKGCTMGTKCPPTYADVFMSNLRKRTFIY